MERATTARRRVEAAAAADDSEMADGVVAASFELSNLVICPFYAPPKGLSDQCGRHYATCPWLLRLRLPAPRRQHHPQLHSVARNRRPRTS